MVDGDGDGNGDGNDSGVGNIAGAGSPLQAAMGRMQGWQGTLLLSLLGEAHHFQSRRPNVDFASIYINHGIMNLEDCIS